MVMNTMMKATTKELKLHTLQPVTCNTPAEPLKIAYLTSTITLSHCNKVQTLTGIIANGYSSQKLVFNRKKSTIICYIKNSQCR